MADPVVVNNADFDAVSAAGSESHRLLLDLERSVAPSQFIISRLIELRRLGSGRSAVLNAHQGCLYIVRRSSLDSTYQSLARLLCHKSEL